MLRKIHGTENNMVMAMLLVDVSSNDILILAAEDFIGKLPPDLVEMCIRDRETAYTALKERELQDNAIAAEKGLKPYTLLNVEFNDGADQQSNGYIGWYYATLAVDGKICTHLETGLNHDIASGSVSPTPTRENYYAAGALKESDVDYVFNNVGFSSASGLYSLHLSDAARAVSYTHLRNR